MENQSGKIIIVILVIVVVLSLTGGILWYGQTKKPSPEPLPVSKPKETSLGAQIFERTQNPVKDQVPNTNPFSADTNPFDTKTNPFKDKYKNPFR